MNTVPISGKFAEIKKQVKFEKKIGFEIEQVRKDYETNNKSIEISRKNSISQKGILRNKSIEVKKKL